MKRQLEFFAADTIREAQQPGTEEKVLSFDADDPAVLTRLVRWVPGLDTSSVSVITREYVEEVYLMEGELTDLTLGRTFRAGHYASRRPGYPTAPTARLPAAPCSKSDTASPHDELAGAAVIPGAGCTTAPSSPTNVPAARSPGVTGRNAARNRRPGILHLRISALPQYYMTL